MGESEDKEKLQKMKVIVNCFFVCHMLGEQQLKESGTFNTKEKLQGEGISNIERSIPTTEGIACPTG